MLHRSVHYNAREDMTSIQPIALPEGSNRLKGDVTILDRAGRPLPERGSPVYLGRSADKPFCDGSHASTGWKEDA
jgi:hypothetical protein